MNRYSTVTLACAALGLVFPTADVASEQQPRFLTGTHGVFLEVSVFGSRGPVSGLAREDFEVTDGGKPVREFLVSEVSDLPLDIVTVVQPAASQTGAKLRLFEGSVRALFAEVRPDDRLGVVLASSPPQRVRPVGSGTLALEPVWYTGTTEAAPWDAVGTALAAFDDSEKRKVLILVADGIDRRSALSADMVTNMVHRSRIQQIAVLGSAASLIEGITVQVVPGVGSMGRPINKEVTADYGNAFPTHALQGFVRNTGGQIIDLMSKDPQRVVEDLMARLRGGYVITYAGTGTPGWHPVAVRVKRRGLTVLTRAGYEVGEPHRARR